MSDYHKKVEAAIRATRIHSPTIYSWFGKRSPRLPLAVKRAFTPQTARSYLLSSIQFQLYSNFYCQGFATPVRSEAAGFLVLAGYTSFVQQLSAANSGNGYWEVGWEVSARDDDKVIVHRDGLELQARLEDCLVSQGSSIAPGMRLSLRFGKEFIGISPGFYMALSNEELTQVDSKNLVRFYWNLTQEGAVRFMQNVTSMLNRAKLPFKLKVVNDPARFIRCDVVVLYIRKSDYDVVSESLERIYPEVAASLKHSGGPFRRGRNQPRKAILKPRL